MASYGTGSSISLPVKGYKTLNVEVNNIDTRHTYYLKIHVNDVLEQTISKVGIYTLDISGKSNVKLELDPGSNGTLSTLPISGSYTLS